MSLDGGEQAGVIWGGVATVLVLGGAIFKAAGLRGSTTNEWYDRVKLAKAVLNDKTSTELRELRDEINELLPPDDAPFDPVDVIADPSPLIERAERATNYRKARDRMEVSLERVQKIGHALVAGLVAGLVGVIALTIFYSDVVAAPGSVRIAGFVLVGLSALMLACATAVYIVCQARLSRGEILAGTSGRGIEDER